MKLFHLNPVQISKQVKSLETPKNQMLRIIKFKVKKPTRQEKLIEINAVKQMMNLKQMRTRRQKENDAKKETKKKKTKKLITWTNVIQ